MVTVALYVQLEAKPGKETEVEAFLKGGLAIVQGEPATTAWFALRLGPTTFGIFDAFPDEAGRQAHLTGRVAAALMQKAGRAPGEAAGDREGGRPRGQAAQVASARRRACAGGLCGPARRRDRLRLAHQFGDVTGASR